MTSLVFNIDAFADLIQLEDEGTPGLIADLIADFLVSSQTLRGELESSAKVRDMVLLERSAHSLKSSSKLLGLDKVAEVAYRIEDGARSGRVELDDVGLISLYLEPALDELTRFRDSRPTAR